MFDRDEIERFVFKLKEFAKYMKDQREMDNLLYIISQFEKGRFQTRIMFEREKK